MKEELVQLARERIADSSLPRTWLVACDGATVELPSRFLTGCDHTDVSAS